MLQRLRAASSSADCMYERRRPGPSPPSSSGFDGSTITFAGSKAHVLPRPWQSRRPRTGC